MGLELFTFLVDDDWLFELATAARAKAEGLPVPPVRWPVPESDAPYRKYLSHDPLEWPETFTKMIGVWPETPNLPEGYRWYCEMTNLLELIPGLLETPEFADDKALHESGTELVNLGAAFFYFRGWHNDYSPHLRSSVLLSPTSCAALRQSYAKIEFAALRTLFTKVRELHDQGETSKECRIHLQGRAVHEMFQDVFANLDRSCEESVRTHRALSVYAG